MALSYARIILGRLQEKLKPRGFRKQGQTFLRPVADCWQIVNLQASQWGDASEQRYTLNLAVYSTRLEPLAKVASKLKEYDGHWRARIGSFTREERDAWWEVRDDAGALVAAEAMVAQLPLALEAMDGISTYEAILRIPPGSGSTSDDPPGSTRNGLIDEARGREGLPPHPFFRHGPGWRSSWHRRHFPDDVPPRSEPPPTPPQGTVSIPLPPSKHAPNWTFVCYDKVAATVEDEDPS